MSKHKIQFLNSCQLLTSLENKVALQVYQLNPTSLREKRGLINGLGTVVKFLTGNLDHNDAEKYDNAINMLSHQQGKIESLVSDQITLLQPAIDKFQKNTDILKRNHIILQSRIKQLEKLTTISAGITDVESLLFIETTLSQFQLSSN